METKAFPVIDPVATGDNIRRLREERGMSVKDLQRFFGFEEPRAVYKWQKGETLPSVDNLYALGILLGVPLEAILIPRKKHGPAYKEQQENSCCSDFLMMGCSLFDEDISCIIYKNTSLTTYQMIIQRGKKYEKHFNYCSRTPQE